MQVLSTLRFVQIILDGVLDKQWSQTPHGCFLAAEAPGIVAQHLTQRNTSLPQEMQQFSFYGRVCAMKGLLQALPQDLLCAQLQQLSRTPATDTHSDTHLDPASVNLPQQGVSSSRQEDHGSSGPEHVSSASGKLQEQGSSEAQQGSSGAHHMGNAFGELQEQGPPEAQQGSLKAQQGSSGAQHMVSAAGELKDQGSSQAQQDDTTRASSKRQGSSNPWLLLSDGALPACCAAVQQSTDAHHKFHAVSALAYCLDRVKQCLQVRPGFR